MMIPPMQPVLSDDLVLLRPMTEADRDPLFAVASDPLIWAIHPAHNRWERAVFDAFFNEGLASNGGLVVIDRATGAAIGSSRYDIRVCEAGEVEIGWTYLAREYWGGQYNRSIKRLMLEHAFTMFGTVIFLVGETNFRSQRALEKIGARLTDRRQDWDMAGTNVCHLVYAIGRDDFAQGPLQLQGSCVKCEPVHRA
jgi:N-acetyltransferase